MSRSHIRTATPIARRKPWLERTFFVVAGLLTLTCIILLVCWDRPHEPFVVTHGKVLDTRILVDDIRQSRFGGRIYYRLEARVSYDLGGVPQDRWLTADTLSAEREVIAAQVARNPKNCLVYWKPNHPENARCHLD